MKCTGSHHTIERDGYALAIASPITKINGHRVSPINRHHGEPTESGLKPRIILKIVTDRLANFGGLTRSTTNILPLLWGLGTGPNLPFSPYLSTFKRLNTWHG